eukprot:TRINITY_DN1748_c0_g2_i1.p1 TRINITY_DN1748_c0_g2~~TRINITY_DN1748_c0_g2_i1.p1  ORF type:complete len:940 (-),score=93.90 TRINITY_DN1748_c0_g2_i1:384-3203(-)
MGTKKPTSNNNTVSGSDLGSSSQSNSQLSISKESNRNICQLQTHFEQQELAGTRLPALSSGVQKRAKPKKMNNTNPFAEAAAVGKLPNGPQKNVAAHQIHYVKYKDEKWQQIEQWESSKSKDPHPPLGLGDVLALRLQITQAPQLFGFPHKDGRSYRTPFAVCLTVKADGKGSWTQGINFVAYSLTCQEYDDFENWEIPQNVPNPPAQRQDEQDKQVYPLKDVRCFEQAQMNNQTEVQVDQEFVGLQFVTTSSMSPRYLVFTCQVGGDVLAALYTIPTILLSRKNEQFKRAFAKLIKRGGVPIANINFLVSQGFMSESIRSLCPPRETSSEVQSEISWCQFCDVFVKSYKNCNFTRQISNEELAAIYERLSYFDARYICEWIEQTMVLLLRLRKLWEIQFPYAIISPFDVQKKESEEILTDGAYGDFIIRVSFSELGALSAVVLGKKRSFPHSMQTDKIYYPTCSTCIEIRPCIVYDIYENNHKAHFSAPEIVLQRILRLSLFQTFIAFVDNQRRRLPKESVAELGAQHHIQQIKFSDTELFSEHNIQTLLMQSNNNDNIFMDIFENPICAQQRQQQQLFTLQQQQQQQQQLFLQNQQSSSGLVTHMQAGYKTYGAQDIDQYLFESCIARSNDFFRSNDFSVTNQSSNNQLVPNLPCFQSSRMTDVAHCRNDVPRMHSRFFPQPPLENHVFLQGFPQPNFAHNTRMRCLPPFQDNVMQVDCEVPFRPGIQFPNGYQSNFPLPNFDRFSHIFAHGSTPTHVQRAQHVQHVQNVLQDELMNMSEDPQFNLSYMQRVNSQPQQQMNSSFVTKRETNKLEMQRAQSEFLVPSHDAPNVVEQSFHNDISMNFGQNQNIINANTSQNLQSSNPSEIEGSLQVEQQREQSQQLEELYTDFDEDEILKSIGCHSDGGIMAEWTDQLLEFVETDPLKNADSAQGNVMH